jgi:hypothetical protein
LAVPRVKRASLDIGLKLAWGLSPGGGEDVGQIVVLALFVFAFLGILWMSARGMIIGVSILVGALLRVSFGFVVGVALGPDTSGMHELDQVASGFAGGILGLLIGPILGGAFGWAFKTWREREEHQPPPAEHSRST